MYTALSFKSIVFVDYTTYVYSYHHYKSRTYVAAYNAYVRRLVVHIIISITDTASDERTYLCVRIQMLEYVNLCH